MPLTRRSALGLSLAASAATVAGCSRPDPSPELKPASVRDLVRPASPSPGQPSASYGADVTQGLRRYLVPTPENPDHPIYAGAVAQIDVAGVTTVHTAVGHALRYGAGPVDLPQAQRVTMRRDSVFDVASITKVFTAILALQQVDRGLVDLAAPVVRYLPEFTGAGKAAVTVQMLLTHTSGLPVGVDVRNLPGPAERRAAVLATPLVGGAVPGRTFRYSSTGLIVLGYLVERVTGLPLDEALRVGVTTPLGLRDTGFRPTRWMSAADVAARVVATDARTSRGLLRGVVHDDVANVLGGVAGHAGLFTTAADLTVIGRMLLAGGTYGGQRILEASTVERMLANATPGLPVVDVDHPDRPSDHGLGVALNQPWYMGRFASTRTFGHTGFTGTSLLVDPRYNLVIVVLTNRAHPNWTWSNPDPARTTVANLVANALIATSVGPRGGGATRAGTRR